MIVPIRRSLLVGIASAIAGLTAFAFAAPVYAQAYPSRPITLIVPWGARGAAPMPLRASSAACLKRNWGSRSTSSRQHWRQRRRRPRSDRLRSARWIHDRPGYR